MAGLREGEEVRTRPQTRALNQEVAVELIVIFGPEVGGKVIDGLLMVQQASREPGELPDFPVQKVGPEPASYSAARSSEYWA